MIRAVIFDIDDTLSDWPSAIDHALAAVLPELPVSLRGQAPERLRRAVAERYHVVRDGRVVNREHWKLLFESVQAWQQALPEVEVALIERLGRRFQSQLSPVPFADARPALEALQGRFQLATLSNNPRSEDALSLLDLREFFTEVVSAVDDWRKPDARAFQRVCEATGIAAREALYVGDSLSHDVEVALAAGLTPVWLDRYDTPGGVPDGAHRIASLTELPALAAALSHG